MPIAGKNPLSIHKQEKFCLFRAQGMSPSEAHAAAGYTGTDRSANTALANKPKVRARVAYLRARVEDRVVQTAAVTQHEVLEIIRRNIAKAEKGTPIQDRMGHVVGHKVSFSDVNRGAELLGRTVGMFVDVTGKVEDLGKHLEDMTDDQIRAYAATHFESMDPSLRKHALEKRKKEEQVAEEEAAPETGDDTGGPTLQ